MLAKSAALCGKIGQGLGKINHPVCRWSRNVAGGLLALMVAMILAQVLFRHGLNNSLAWTEELARFAMVWVACLVAPWAYRENLNVAIELFAASLAPKLRLLSELCITLLIIVISSIFLQYAIDFWVGGLTISASSLPVKLAVFYSAIPFAFVLLILVAVERLFAQLHQLLGLFCAPLTEGAN